MKAHALTFRAACLLGSCLVLAASLVPAADADAGETAVIRNKALAIGGGKEVDAAVSIGSIDSRRVQPGNDSLETAAGKHSLVVLCRARVFVGMGTVDFDTRAVMDVDLEAGRTYQLGARATVKGDCIPVIE